MSGPEILIPIAGICAVFGIPLSAIWTKHRQEMERIKAASNAKSKAAVPSNVAEELAALRAEVTSLRETTTRFDMSFDAALTRLEQRVDGVEERQTVAPQPQWQQAPQEESVVVLRQGR